VSDSEEEEVNAYRKLVGQCLDETVEAPTSEIKTMRSKFEKKTVFQTSTKLA